MPMSGDFKKRLEPKLHAIVDHYGTPFHIFDETGIRSTCQRLKSAFKNFPGFQEFFAVKANPNHTILKIVKDEGFGFDCSSVGELLDVRYIGAKPEDIMFTSNNTTVEEFKVALGQGGCILNLDDITLIDKVPGEFPKLICYRFNPGDLRQGGSEIIGKPTEAKYGVAHFQIIEAYKRAMELGARRFGLHTMIISNELNYKYIVETVKMLLDLIKDLHDNPGIIINFINKGGGLGIPYYPGDEEIPLERMAKEIRKLMDKFIEKNGYEPKLYMESGRYMIGPHGVLVTTCINQKHTYKEWRGVDASMPANPRPAMYYDKDNERSGYHHITVLGGEDRPQEIVSVVGSLCENCDQFARDRLLPKMEEGDIVIIHDTGAHAVAMGGQYNARLKPKELLLKDDGSVELIRREQTYEDYIATLQFKPDLLTF